MKRAFKVKQKTFFIISKVFLIDKNFLRPDSQPVMFFTLHAGAFLTLLLLNQ